MNKIQQAPDGWVMVPRDVLFKWQEAKAVAPSAPAVAEPLTMEQVFASDDIMTVNASIGLHMDQIMRFVHATERAHGIGTKGSALKIEWKSCQ